MLPAFCAFNLQVHSYLRLDIPEGVLLARQHRQNKLVILTYRAMLTSNTRRWRQTLNTVLLATAITTCPNLVMKARTATIPGLCIQKVHYFLSILVYFMLAALSYVGTVYRLFLLGPMPTSCRLRQSIRRIFLDRTTVPTMPP